MNFIFWCEFPGRTNWDNLAKWLEELDMNIIIYIACTSRKNYEWWKREIKKTSNRIVVNAWPTLLKEDGYWFSGFVSKKNIDKLLEYKGLNVKIDLEPPFKGDYTNLRMINYVLKYLFKKGKNNEYLLKTIKKLNKNTHLLVNMFPFPKWYLKRCGCYVPKSLKVKRQYMAYTSISGPKLIGLMRIYDKINFGLRKRKEKFSVSIGLIGEGILNTEGVYKNTNDLKKDLDMVKSLKINDVCIYSIDSISKKNKSWLQVIKKYSTFPKQP